MEKKLVTVDSNKRLPIYGGIYGPITNPCEMSIADIIVLINNRIRVYEVNPNNTSQKVLLGLNNVTKDNFPQRIVRPVKIPTSNPSANTIDTKSRATIAHEAIAVKHECEEKSRTLPEYIYGKDGTVYCLEGEGYNQYSSKEEMNLLKCGVVYEVLEEMINNGEASLTEYNKRPVPKKSTKKKSSKKHPSPNNFKK